MPEHDHDFNGHGIVTFNIGRSQHLTFYESRCQTTGQKLPLPCTHDGPRHVDHIHDHLLMDLDHNLLNHHHHYHLGVDINLFDGESTMLELSQ